MPGKDGTGPLGMGPCGKGKCACREKQAEEKTNGKGRKAEVQKPDGIGREG
jgi:hypothetical protein